MDKKVSLIVVLMIDLRKIPLKDQISEIEMLLEQYDRTEDVVVLSDSHMAGSLALSKAAGKGIKCRVTPWEDGNIWEIVFISVI